METEIVSYNSSSNASEETYINQFGKALNHLGLLVQVHSHLVLSYARAERIGQSPSVIINPQSGNGLECG